MAQNALGDDASLLGAAALAEMEFAIKPAYPG